MARHSKKVVEAIAEAWASIDGKVLAFKSDRDGNGDSGCYEGYMTEAEELLNRACDNLGTETLE